MSRVLVAVFSATGTTLRAGKLIAQELGADLFEIEPVERYTSADLNWRNTKSRSSVEMADESLRPALAKELPELSVYDAIIVGFPIWWGVAPRVVDTFLDAVEKQKVKVAIFATSGGSGIEEAVAGVKKLHPAIEPFASALVSMFNADRWAKALEI